MEEVQPRRAADVLEILRRKGVAVRAEGGHLMAGPAERVKGEAIELLRAHKPALLAHLSGPDDETLAALDRWHAANPPDWDSPCWPELFVLRWEGMPPLVLSRPVLDAWRQLAAEARAKADPQPEAPQGPKKRVRIRKEEGEGAGRADRL